MGRNALGEVKDKFITVRVTEDTKLRVKAAMTALKYTGQEKDFLLWLVIRGLELAEYEQTLLQGSAAALVQSRQTSKTA